MSKVQNETGNFWRRPTLVQTECLQWNAVMETLGMKRNAFISNMLHARTSSRICYSSVINYVNNAIQEKAQFVF